MKYRSDILQKTGDFCVTAFHYLALFLILLAIIWSGGQAYLEMIDVGRFQLGDILLLFIYLELGAMVGVYFRTRRLPVRFLIFIAITALSRHLVIDVQKVSEPFHLYLLMTITLAIIVLSAAILLLSVTEKKYGQPDV
ncbi:MAG: phosphate-starvation-inducible PsiE family protein [Pelovirga sp.]